MSRISLFSLGGKVYENGLNRIMTQDEEDSIPLICMYIYISISEPWKYKNTNTKISRAYQPLTIRKMYLVQGWDQKTKELFFLCDSVNQQAI